MTSRLPLIILPDPDEPGAAEVYVDGLLNGEPYRFLLDTGAARSSVMADALTETLPVRGEHSSSGVFAPTQDDLVLVESIALGPIRRSHLLMTRVREGAGQRSNLLGMDVLRDHRCHFCFDRGELVIDGAERVDAGAWESLQFDQKFHPYVAVNSAAGAARAVWDSGASLTVAATSFIDQHPALFTESGSSTGTDAGGAQVETPMFLIAEVVIGGKRFPPHRVAAVDLSPVNAALEIPMDLILGCNLTRQANWLFDFPNRRYQISTK